MFAVDVEPVYSSRFGILLDCVADVFTVDAGAVYSWGCGEHGQLGQGDQQDVLRPTEIPSLKDKKITSVSCAAVFSGTFDYNDSTLFVRLWSFNINES